LVRAVAPHWVLYPVGYRNRWDFPSAEVMPRWWTAGAARADCGGALHVAVGPERGVVSPIAWRERYRRFWHADCVTEGDAEGGGA
jgi:competence protein ComEC